MKLHSPLAAKRLRSYLRVAFFMIRKVLISKRKLIIDINLLMKRGKLIGKALGNHVFHIHHHAWPSGYRYGPHEYEFSCSDSPNIPAFFHAKRGAHRNYFPCISALAEEDDERPPINVPSSAAASAAAEEEEEAEENNEVDEEAEEFIRRFYEQLRRQSRFALLQYEMDYREMLARGF